MPFRGFGSNKTSLKRRTHYRLNYCRDTAIALLSNPQGLLGQSNCCLLVSTVQTDFRQEKKKKQSNQHDRNSGEKELGKKKLIALEDLKKNFGGRGGKGKMNRDALM